MSISQRSRCLILQLSTIRSISKINKIHKKKKPRRKRKSITFLGVGGVPIWWDTLAPDVGRLRDHKCTAEDQSTLLEPTGGSLVFLK